VSTELLIATHDLCWLHDPGRWHPESADRLTAVRAGLEIGELDGAIGWVEAPEASPELIERVHPAALMERVRQLAEVGGGPLDADTVVSADSAAAAARAAGAGLDLVERLDRGEASAGWSVVRPPGHHATSDTQMGFCLINNIAVTARHLADRGERVLIVDVDAHHGNGTQDVFYDDPNVLFVSFHQYPLYPGTGRPGEAGSGAGLGATVNVALPPGTTGDVYLRAVDTVVAPVVDRFDPTWVLVSAGFDAHRADPLTEMGLTSGDFADLIARILPMAPAGRRLLFLEGGYDLQALTDSAAAVAAAIVDVDYRPEEASSGGPGDDHVALAHKIHLEEGPDTWGS
jgi:acetoin utilization deacetylase AcuC-like enzyme